MEGDGWSTSPHHQRAVVIGGTSGIGFAVAEPALAEGAEVVVASRSQERVEAALKRPLPWPPGPRPARRSRPPPLAHSLRKAPLKYLHEGI
ncbi:SDR family NAD(P)-dependent oxidoreductase [Streptomyces justiciae]|uniref:SDR family NAD(P)-dependent oxidoreductase n=1 Tax=Streptomyces justiciae TaxID=2780140 RepID=A0ABU3M6K9_9ACTN|nr:SDR family NAD(P)-dependent oxidoreductase [Streptomyces justiciae]MDT7846348.1 SDR family NAD(P)-dependent oxidoreductase [Streptomyces justiciae]